MAKYDLSLILACYNDGDYLETSFQEIVKTLDMAKFSYEIIFVYDCGQDNTPAVMDKLIHKYGKHKVIKKIVHEKNEGRGKAVRSGIAAAEGKIAGYIDVDLDVHPRYIPSMVSAILDDGYDVATAFRYYKVHPNPVFVMRHILSHGYRFISRKLLHENLMDSESGYKFFRRDKVMPLCDMSKHNGWFWDTEIMCYCIYKDLKIKEIPYVFERRGDKKSSVRVISTVFGYFKSLIEFNIYIEKHKKELFGK